MSEKARHKRAMRLRGEKRVDPDKQTGLADHMIPGLRLDMLADRLYEHDPGISLIADSDQWMGRFEMSEENLDSAGDGLDIMQRLVRRDVVFKEDYTAAGEWLQRNEDYGRKADRSEAELSRTPDTVTGEELESGEIQSRARDHETLEEEGTTPAETPDDQR